MCLQIIVFLQTLLDGWQFFFCVLFLSAAYKQHFTIQMIFSCCRRVLYINIKIHQQIDIYNITEHAVFTEKLEKAVSRLHNSQFNSENICDFNF